MAQKHDMYKLIADELVKKLQEGTAPWQKPWDNSSVLPYNAITGRRYRGGNVLSLMSQKHSDDPRWLTYHQAYTNKTPVRKGEKGTPVIYWKFDEQVPQIDKNGKPVLDENGKPQKVTVHLERPKFFINFVFNASQVDGLAPIEQKKYEWSPVEKAEEILVASKAKIIHEKQGHAFYSPVEDLIVLPKREQFYNAEGYYDTALHELGHWTGHESRLNRDLLNPKGSTAYAQEELRAEITSMLLSHEVGILHDTSNHAAYVGHWIKILQDDPKELFRAASDAEKATDYVLGRMQTLEQNKELETPSIERSVATMSDFEQSKSEPEQDTRTYLSVPFDEKEEAKELGAKWDRQKRQWYVPSSLEQNVFSKWSNAEEKPEEKQKTAEERLYLAVSYYDRYKAKKLGAKWDAEAKSWYVSQNLAAEEKVKFGKWLPEQQEQQSPAISPREEFAEALKSIGCILEDNGQQHPVMDGNKQRIATQGDAPNEQAGFYVAHLDGRPAGYAINNRTGEEVRWKYSGQLQAQSKEEQKAFQAMCEARKAEWVATQQKLYEDAAQKVRLQIESLKSVSEPTPYMKTKGILVQQGALVDEKGTTCLPAQDVNGVVWTMQNIYADGTKRFQKDGKKEGCFHAVGGFNALQSAPVLIIAEGYATASSLSEAVNLPTVAAFDAGNIAAVANALHEKYPNKAMLIAGDDDRHLSESVGKNVGRIKAERAAKELGIEVIFPIFTPEEKGKEFTDFNDLAVKSKLGLEGLKRQITPVLKKAIEKNNELLKQKQNKHREQKQENSYARQHTI